MSPEVLEAPERIQEVLANGQSLTDPEDFAFLRPPPRQTTWQWADKHRIISRGNSEPGRWKTARVPYQIGLMEAATDPAVTKITAMMGAQTGKTDALILDKLHCNLGDSPHDHVRAGDLRDRIVTVLRQPARIERLRPLVIEDVLEAVIAQELHGVFEFAGQNRVFPIHDRVDVLAQQDFQQRTFGPAGA